jgi:enoyl-CoA hydratase/carnithine racemase
MKQFETLLVEVDADHVAHVVLNRPTRLNAFNTAMMRELQEFWAAAQANDEIHAVFLRGAKGRAFCTGIDVHELEPIPENIWNLQDPGYYISPKQNKCWKPVVTAVHGMAVGGAFYLINESDIVICSEDATFFDPHVTYGMTSACEPIGMTYRMNLGDVLRMVLLGNDERVGARSALAKGIVSEVLSDCDALWRRGRELAARIAAKPTVATQGSVRAIWESLDMHRTVALRTSVKYPLLGNDKGTAQVDRASVMAAAKKFDVI